VDFKGLQWCSIDTSAHISIHEQVAVKGGGVLAQGGKAVWKNEGKGRQGFVGGTVVCGVEAAAGGQCCVWGAEEMATRGKDEGLSGREVLVVHVGARGAGSGSWDTPNTICFSINTNCLCAVLCCDMLCRAMPCCAVLCCVVFRSESELSGCWAKFLVLGLALLFLGKQETVEPTLEVRGVWGGGEGGRQGEGDDGGKGEGDEAGKGGSGGKGGGKGGGELLCCMRFML